MQSHTCWCWELDVPHHHLDVGRQDMPCFFHIIIMMIIITMIIMGIDIRSWASWNVVKDS
jgi:hypothetical protein